MQYMCLIYTVENAGPQRGDPEFGEFMQNYMSFTQEVNEAGVFVSGNELQSIATATTVSMEQTL